MSANVVIVGRPNVGKSSLFNALLGYRRAIVLDHPGTTMDEVAERTVWGACSLILVDSQGILSEKDRPVLSKALLRADVVLFVVDALSGVTPFDRWIATEVRLARKPTLLCVNKTEGKRRAEELDFAELGWTESVSVSAVHRRNIDPIKEWCLRHLGFATNESEDLSQQDAGEGASIAPLTLALIGRPNTGKSTLMNQFCHAPISRVSPVPHTTRDPVSHEIETPQGIIRLLDTAGIRRPRSKKEALEIFSIQASTRAIRNSDVIFLLLASHEPISDQDMRLLNLIEREGRPAAVLLNFWDTLDAKARKAFFENTEFASYLSRFRTLPISGLTGWNVNECLPLAFRLFKQSHRRVKTSRLNRLVENIVAKNPPPTAGRQNFNILYASQVKVDPPTFVFFMNRKAALPVSYQRYLENRLRRDLGFKGQTLRVYFRGERD